MSHENSSISMCLSSGPRNNAIGHHFHQSEEIIIYEHTSHSSNIKTLIYYASQGNFTHANYIGSKSVLHKQKQNQNSACSLYNKHSKYIYIYI